MPPPLNLLPLSPGKVHRHLGQTGPLSRDWHYEYLRHADSGGTRPVTPTVRPGSDLGLGRVHRPGPPRDSQCQWGSSCSPLAVLSADSAAGHWQPECQQAYRYHYSAI